ncbi:MAG: flagellar biosynthetic protein FliQ [Polyangiaceae bacterium]|jgi:flagellar biosynthesis protein FliQ|nr:flagellar biosynthetic protein FliQ [Polyangiaceae bacterium]
MTPDQALELLRGLIGTALWLSAPPLLAMLVAGVGVGIVQAATQINEASIAYLVKVTVFAAVLALAGPTLAAHAVSYTRQSFEAVSRVVR